jgi:hypothetical protein
MEKYTIRRKILDAYDTEADRIEDFAIVECGLSSAKTICYSLSYGEAWEGDPYTSYHLFDLNGSEIPLRKPENE